MTKQYKALKKMENQLLEMGMASGSLEEIKQRAMRGIGGNSEQK
jgi:Fe2+ transport system protein FeoA